MGARLLSADASAGKAISTGFSSGSVTWSSACELPSGIGMIRHDVFCFCSGAGVLDTQAVQVMAYFVQHVVRYAQPKLAHL